MSPVWKNEVLIPDIPLTGAQLTENTPKIPVRFSLTGTRRYLNVSNTVMNEESTNGNQSPAKKAEFGYNLRFRSRAQKKRIEDAAARSHKTLRDFLLDLGEAAASELKEQKAS